MGEKTLLQLYGFSANTMGEYISLNLHFLCVCVCVCVCVMVGGSWERMGLFACMRGCELVFRPRLGK